MAFLISSGKTYTLTNEWNNSDAGDAELTNGILSSTNHSDGNLVYFGNNSTISMVSDIVIDLARNISLSHCRFHYYRVDSLGVPAPASCVISGSDDNSNWTSLGTFSNTTHWSVADTTNGWTKDLPITGRYRYIKFSVTAGANVWFTPSEFEVYGVSDIKKINGVYMGSQEIASTRFAGDAALKAYYRFETGALTTDSSGAGHTLTAISDPAEGTGKFGGGVDLDGNDAYSATDHADFKPTSAFTVGGWIKTSTTADYQFIFQSYSANTNIAGFRMYLNQTAGNIIFFSGKNSGTSSGTDYQYIINSVNLADGNWHFAVGVWDGSYLKLYVDGISATTPVSWANAPAYAATNYVRIGCSNNTGTNAQFFTGSLDDIFLLNGTALTSDEIYSIYKTGVKKLNGQVNLNPELESTSLRGDANLQMYHRLEGNSTDETANNNDGTDTGITYGTNYGKMGQGASFTNDDTSTGASSYISIANSASLSPGTGNFSISLWYKTSDTRTANIHGIINKYNSSANNNVYYIIEAATTGYITAFFRDGDGDGVSMAATKSYRDGIWHHIVSVRDGTTGHLYIDGSLVTSTTNASMSNIDTNTAGSYFWIGTFSSNTTPGQRTQSFTGNLDDLAVFNKALTATEISNLYNTNIKKYMGVSNV